MNPYTEKQVYFILIIFLCVLVGCFSKYLSWHDLSFIAYSPSGGEKEILPRVVVEIGGMVAHPGIYCFPHNVSVGEAVNRAGGVRGGVELGQDICDAGLLHGTKITVTALPPLLIRGQMSPQARILYFIPIDVNTAVAEDLVAVPGIGEKTAKNIVEYRRRNGPFPELKELKKVRGIGANNFTKIREHLTCASAALNSSGSRGAL